MRSIQDKLNDSLWSSVIKEFSYNFAAHQIIIHAEATDSGVTRQSKIVFDKVSAVYFDYYFYDSTHQTDVEAWQVIDLAEIHYLPELDKRKELSDFLKSTADFNFLLEMYTSRLFIKSDETYLNGELLT